VAAAPRRSPASSRRTRGPRRFTGGVLEVAKLADGTNVSSLGTGGTAGTAAIIINGGTLRYIGAGDSSNRVFRIGDTTAGATGTLDASRTGALVLSATALQYGTANQTRTVNLTGSNTAANTIASVIGNNGTGVVNVTKNGVGTWAVNGANSYTGDTTITSGSLTLGSTGELRFKIQNGDVSNRVLGTGTAIFDGDFVLDVSGLTATSGTWNLVNVSSLNESFHATSFDVRLVGGSDFNDAGGGLYTSESWTFDKGTGNLVLAVPEPASTSLLAVAALMLGRRRRRSGNCRADLSRTVGA
jgi:autotransporter-associated beta strand protein